ncbi:MAG TPA: hypothetical protein VN176_08400 [Verrucomicrobiae bacterium]|nr:hypothetical protein [Verrucomicrobiae bacterium]
MNTSNRNEQILGFAPTDDLLVLISGWSVEKTSSQIAPELVTEEDLDDVVQQHLQLLQAAPRVPGQLRCTTAERTPLEAWLPGNLSMELWWFPVGLTSNQSEHGLRCAPFGPILREHGVWMVPCGSA